MNCNECNDKHNGKYQHELALAMAERVIKRLWILAILLAIMLVGTNIAWIVYESQWEVVEESTEVVQEAEGNGNNHFIGGNYYGKANSEDYNSPQDP